MIQKSLIVLGAVLGLAAWLPAAAVSGSGTVTRDPVTQAVPRPDTGRAVASYAPVTTAWTPLRLALVSPVELPFGSQGVRGLRISLFYGGCVRLKGLDVGLFNGVSGAMDGLQVGAVNVSGRVRGVQAGVINTAVALRGLQVGLINLADEARGLQIGLVNVITESAPGFFPIVYGSF